MKVSEARRAGRNFLEKKQSGKAEENRSQVAAATGGAPGASLAGNKPA